MLGKKKDKSHSWKFLTVFTLYIDHYSKWLTFIKGQIEGKVLKDDLDLIALDFQLSTLKYVYFQSNQFDMK